VGTTAFDCEREREEILLLIFWRLLAATFSNVMDSRKIMGEGSSRSPSSCEESLWKDERESSEGGEGKRRKRIEEISLSPMTK